MSKGPQEALDHVPQTDAQWELWVISPPSEALDDDDAPVLAILFDRSAETVRDVVEMTAPMSLDAVVDVVVEAMVHPKPPGAPMRPRRLVVFDAPLHAPLGLALSAFGVDIVAGDERKVDFEALAAQLTTQLPPMPHGLFTNAPHRERALCGAARDFLDTEGWRALRPWDVIKLTPTEDADALHHPIITIRAWEPLGVVMNRDAQEALDFYNDATHVGEDPLFAERYDVLWILFTNLEDIPEEAHEALAAGHLLTSGGLVPRFYHIGGQQPDDAPGPRASNHLVTSLKALTAFFERHQPIDEQGLLAIEDTIHVDGVEIHVATRPDLCLDPD